MSLDYLTLVTVRVNPALSEDSDGGYPDRDTQYSILNTIYQTPHPPAPTAQAYYSLHP